MTPAAASLPPPSSSPMPLRRRMASVPAESAAPSSRFAHNEFLKQWLQLAGDEPQQYGLLHLVLHSVAMAFRWPAWTWYTTMLRACEEDSEHFNRLASERVQGQVCPCPATLQATRRLLMQNVPSHTFFLRCARCKMPTPVSLAASLPSAHFCSVLRLARLSRGPTPVTAPYLGRTTLSCSSAVSLRSLC